MLKQIVLPPVDTRLATWAADTRNHYEAMSDDDKRKLLRRQAREFARAEALIGSDADEAAYALALSTNDQPTLALLDVEAEARVAAVEAIFDRSPYG